MTTISFQLIIKNQLHSVRSVSCLFCQTDHHVVEDFRSINPLGQPLANFDIVSFHHCSFQIIGITIQKGEQDQSFQVHLP